MKKGIMLITNNVEDGEVVVPRDLLLRGKILIDLVSVLDSKEIKTSYGLNIVADFNLSEVNLNDYDFLMIPGGKYVKELLDGVERIEERNKVLEVIEHFTKSRKLITSICAGPRFLAYHGLLDDIEFTCYPGCQYDMQGEYLSDSLVVYQNNIITARSIAASVEYGLKIIEVLYGTEMKEEVKRQIVY